MQLGNALSMEARVVHARQPQRPTWVASASPAQPQPPRCSATTGAKKSSVATAATATASRTQSAPLSTVSRPQQQGARPAEQHPCYKGLASYKLRTQDIPCRWLEACVREAVTHIAEAPFIQVALTVSSRGPAFERIPLPAVDSLSGQMWKGMSQHMADQRGAETVLYLAPLPPSPAAPSSPLRRYSRSRRHHPEVLTGVTATPAPVLRGHVGSCCDEDESSSASASGTHAAQHSHDGDLSGHSYSSQIVTYSPQGRGGSGGGQSRTVSSRRRGAELPTEVEWGLVLQSRWHEGLNGCYILRTSSSSDPTCQCTHFSVVRAHEDSGITDQILDAWRAQ